MTSDSDSSKENQPRRKPQKIVDMDLVRLKQNLDALNVSAAENDIAMSAAHISSLFSLFDKKSD